MECGTKATTASVCFKDQKHHSEVFTLSRHSSTGTKGNVVLTCDVTTVQDNTKVHHQTPMSASATRDDSNGG